MIKLRIMGCVPGTLTPDDNQRWWICGDPVKTHTQHGGMSKESRGIQRQRTTEQGPGYPFVKPKDTANESLTLSFTTSRLFASLEEAWVWRNSFSRLVATQWPHQIQGDCVMRLERGDGTWTEERLYDCLLTKPTMDIDGLTISLNYTLTGGRIEPYAEGEDAILIANAPIAGYVHMKLFGDTNGGDDFTDYKSFKNFGLPSDTELTTGCELTVNIRDVDAAVIEPPRVFEVISPGGSVGTPGNIPILTPLHEHLADVAAYFTGNPKVSALHVTETARPYVLFRWLAVPEDDPNAIICTISAATVGAAQITEEGTSAADNVPDTPPSYLVDNNGDVLVADFPLA